MNSPVAARLPSPSSADPGRPTRSAASPPSVWRMAWRQLRRDFRAGELRLILLAVALAVAALSAVGFLADRMQSSLARDARTLLGGDAVVASDQPLPADFDQTAQGMGLATAWTATFPSMARHPRDLATGLVAVKAVSARYPLRGRPEIEVPGGSGAVLPKQSASGPPPGEAWVDAAVLDLLQIQVGDGLLLGDASLRVGAVLKVEPDRGAGFLNFAPRLLMNADDLTATRLIQPASRVTWRLAVAGREGRGADTAVKGFVSWAEETVQQRRLRGARVESLESARPEMRQTLDRAGQFLQLVAVLSALLAAVAVGIAARGFAQRHLDACAMLRVLGQPQRRIAATYSLELLMVGLLASGIGLLLGLAVQQGFVALLSGLIETRLPAPGAMPALLGLGVGLVLLAAFGLPPVLQLARVPALRVIRRDLGEPRAASLLVLVAALAGFAGLLLMAAADLRLGAIAVAGFGAAWALFAAGGWLAVQALRRFVPETGAPRWLTLARRQLAARPGLIVLQVSALAVGLMALLLLVMLRTDLIRSWRAATPPDAPDRFVINVLPEQAQDFRAALSAAGLVRYDWYPMIRGRLVAVNGRTVRLEDYASDRARRLVDREFNLSHAAELPSHNQVTGGRWTADEADGLSVEEGLAETLGLKLGDRLRFDIAGSPAEGRITSLRKVDWTSMRVNFFVLFPRSQMPEHPATFVAAYRAPSRALDAALARGFPNITSVDVSQQIAQVQRVLDQVVAAVEFLFAFTLAAGLLVLFASVSASRDARARELALLRAFGARRQLLRQVQRAELLTVGALAGGLASGAAMLIAWALARQVFQFDWSAPLWIPLAGTLAGAVLALGAGWRSLHELLERPVSVTLRSAGE